MILASSFSSAQGIGDWQNNTPGGNVMYDAGGGTILMISKTSKEYNGIRSWHFYKNHIIGNTDSEYFVFDEANSNIKVFQYKDQRDDYIKLAKLKPIIWARWYADDWRFYGTFTFYFLILSTIYLFWIVFKLLIVANKSQVPRKRLAIKLGILALIFFRALLDFFPQSL